MKRAAFGGQLFMTIFLQYGEGGHDHLDPLLDPLRLMLFIKDMFLNLAELVDCILEIKTPRNMAKIFNNTHHMS